MANNEKKSQEGTKEKGKKIPINISNEALSAKHTNYVRVAFDKEAFYIDFYFIKYPPNGILLNRFVSTPAQTKRVSELLQRLIRDYEGRYKTSIEVAAEIEQEFGFRPQK